VVEMNLTTFMIRDWEWWRALDEMEEETLHYWKTIWQWKHLDVGDLELPYKFIVFQYCVCGVCVLQVLLAAWRHRVLLRSCPMP